MKHQGSFGEIHLTVRYASLRNKLIILVNACRYTSKIQPGSHFINRLMQPWSISDVTLPSVASRNLFPCSDSGTDSYVRLYLLPDQTWRHRKRTHVKRKTVNPVFNDKYDSFQVASLT